MGNDGAPKRAFPNDDPPFDGTLMAFCPRCNTKLPENAHFCDFCGTHVSGSSKFTARFERELPPEEARPAPVQRSGVECGFCHGFLDLNSEFCDQCGAPVIEAAPPGMVKPKPAAPAQNAPVLPNAVPQKSHEVPRSISQPGQTTPSVTPTAAPGNAKPSGPLTAPPQPKPTSPPTASPPAPWRATPQGTRTIPPSTPAAGSGAKTPLSAPPQLKGVPLRVPMQASATRPGETLTAQRQDPAPQTAAQASAVPLLLQKARTWAFDRFEVFFAKAKPLITSDRWITVVTGIGVVVVIVIGAWYLHRSKAAHQQPPPQVAGALNLPTQPEPTAPADTEAPLSMPGNEVTEAGSRTTPNSLEIPAGTNRRARAHKTTAAAPAAGEASPQAVEMARLENLARDAYTKANYAAPVEVSAIAYSKRVLALDPSNNYSRTLLENSVIGGKYQAYQALKRKDFATARRVANAMAQLLPGRKDIAELQQEIRTREKAATAPNRQEALAKVSFRAYHMHSDKAPADRGPYCVGFLSVVAHHLKFAADWATYGEQLHTLTFACSDVREIKRNLRVASHQAGFHVHTASGNINFAPQDSLATHISEVASACSE